MTAQDNFTVFMTLIRAIMIGFCGMELGFAVTAKDVSFDLKASFKLHRCSHQLRSRPLPRRSCRYSSGTSSSAVTTKAMHFNLK
jgi:hypothetical protein